mgnify:CR=1 FL=1
MQFYRALARLFPGWPAGLRLGLTGLWFLIILGLAAFDLGELLGMQTRASAREEPLVVPLRGSSKGGAVPVLAWCATTKADSLDTDTSLAVVMNVCCLTRHSLASHHSGARAAHRFH